MREAVGPSFSITVDANTTWSAEDAIARIRLFEREDFSLAYLEDPLSPEEVEAIARLQRSLPIDAIGHDSLSDARKLRGLLSAGAIRRIRTGSSFDYSVENQTRLKIKLRKRERCEGFWM